MPYDSQNEAHSEIYRGFHISIQYDRDPLNPRIDYDNAATMVCFHRNYDLGDKHEYPEPVAAVADICGIDADELYDADDRAANVMVDALNKAPLYWLPLYLYDHSGITMNTTGFSCPWDSGQVGIIYITKEQVDKEWCIGDTETQAEYDERIFNYMRSEVKEYDHYLTGQVYGFVISHIDEDEEPTDEIEDGSCWGFTGDYEEHALKEAKAIIDGIHDETAQD